MFLWKIKLEKKWQISNTAVTGISVLGDKHSLSSKTGGKTCLVAEYQSIATGMNNSNL